MTRTDKLAWGLGALICVLLATTGCITINVPAPTPIPTDTPPPTSTPERGFEIREKDEPLSEQLEDICPNIQSRPSRV
ncbi:MAG: hypothetical protein H8D74_01640 [Chloroflexi bacterium]|nr:hypothetical protein [Chloroflexota bacterium]